MSISERPKTRPHLLTAALLVGTFLAALDVNVVGTSLPTIVAQLGGLSLYGWVFSGYLLTSTSTMPLYGGLADLLGRKPMYLAATAMFLLGSVACGAASSMLALIFFRVLQGIGAGGLLPITVTLFGDIYPAHRRALVQGLFSTVWGVSSVLGPLIGGFIVSHVTWRWVFWINLPIGLIAAGLVALTLHERVERVEGQRLDRPGAVLINGLLICLLLGLQLLESGQGATATALLVTAAALLVVLVPQQRRAAHPVLPLALFSHRVVVVSSLLGVATGSLLYGVVAFTPLLIQGAYHGSPTQAGLALVPLSATWTVVTFTTGVLCRWLGYRPVVIFGGLCCAAGAVLLPSIAAGQPLLPLPVPMALIGAGMALTITPMTLVVQDEVPWNRRGAATALMQFFRTIGGMVTVTVLGAVITSRFIAGLPPGELSGGSAQLLDPKRWGDFSPALLAAARRSLGTAISAGYWASAGAGLMMLLFALAFPALRMKPRS